MHMLDTGVPLHEVEYNELPPSLRHEGSGRGDITPKRAREYARHRFRSHKGKTEKPTKLETVVR